MRGWCCSAIAVCAVLVSVTGGCERDAAPTAPAASQPAATADTQPSASELENLREFVAKDTAPIPPAMPTSPPADHAALKYTAPQAWLREAPRTAMRVDQYRLPRVQGDAADGELAVFAGMGGGVADNVARWRAQFSTAGGEQIPDEAFVRETFEVSGLKVTLVDVAGRYQASAMMFGGAAAPPKDGYRMLAAIVETRSGPWYFKAVGPAATMAEHRPAFVEFLKTVSVK